VNIYAKWGIHLHVKDISPFFPMIRLSFMIKAVCFLPLAFCLPPEIWTSITTWVGLAGSLMGAEELN
jgi:hypothetical protein